MITISIIGGLGNQMFQYAAAKALARRRGVGLNLDLGAYRSYEPRAYLLDRLQIPEAASGGAPADASTKHFTRALWRNRATRVFKRFGMEGAASVLGGYCESHFHFDPSFFSLRSPMSLFGYFQSERYFAEIADDLRQCFRPREPLGAQAQLVAERIKASRVAVSVHVRRGDYVNSAEVNSFHGVLGETYYRSALQLLQGMAGSDLTVFLFSDDPAAAKELLDFVPCERIVQVSGDPDRPWEDMALMALCAHHVIANSSFSWWGAWLNPMPDKIVVAPRDWFSPDTLRQFNTCDLYPAGWILV